LKKKSIIEEKLSEFKPIPGVEVDINRLVPPSSTSIASSQEKKSSNGKPPSEEIYQILELPICKKQAIIRRGTGYDWQKCIQNIPENQDAFSTCLALLVPLVKIDGQDVTLPEILRMDMQDVLKLQEVANRFFWGFVMSLSSF
jgi:hypothetical protein